MMTALAKRGINEIMVEAGSTLNGALLEAGLIDELIIYMAPKLMGDSAKGLFHLPELHEMAQNIDLDITDIRAVGDDWRITATPNYNKVK
jgi:diaminohydroxyphosphoribosylaminopyrimidine deaminase/5-amino-6-(5-phosphoribosylamino)uracil reductase